MRLHILYEVLLVLAAGLDRWGLLHWLLAAAAEGPGADESCSEGSDGELQ